MVNVLRDSLSNAQVREAPWIFEAEDASLAVPARETFVDAVSRIAPQLPSIAAEIIFSELVSNVVKHAPGRIAIKFEAQNGSAFLRVRDSGPGFLPHPAMPTDLFAESGRGLVLVQEFCSDLRVEISSRGGTCVTAVFDIA